LRDRPIRANMVFPAAIVRQKKIEVGNGDRMAPVKFGVGQSVLRKEDFALIRGKGRHRNGRAAASSWKW
jgi:hypothetical protein